MDSRSIEKILKMIIEVDEDTKTRVATVEDEVAARESQLAKIVSDIETNSELLKITQSKRLAERIRMETEDEQKRILKESDLLMSDMDRVFKDKKDELVRRALMKLSIGKRGNDV